MCIRREGTERECAKAGVRNISWPIQDIEEGEEPEIRRV